jgi:hypothetical protein
VQEEQLLPLLDGLDEVEEAARPACIAAINAYHHAHPGPLVVCSRRVEYEEAAKYHRLSLQSAVVVQPLSHEHVDTYLAQAGKPLEGLRHALNKNLELQELASTPLMLNVLMLTYHRTSVRLSSRKRAELLQQVWTDYVQRMVERKGDTKRYPLERTRSWLHWLARHMREHNQTVFYLEHVQSDWLPPEQQRAYIWFAIRLPGILIGALTSLVLVLFIDGFLPDTVSLLQLLILGGFLGGCFVIGTDTSSADPMSHAQSKPGKRYLTHGAISALIGLLFGLSYGIAGANYYNFHYWLHDASISALVIGLSCWCYLTILSWPPFRYTTSPSTKAIQPWRRLLSELQVPRALLTTVVMGGGMILSYVLGPELYFGSSFDILEAMRAFELSYHSSIGPNLLLSFGLLSLLMSLLLSRDRRDIQLTERLHWTWRSLRSSLFRSRHFTASVFLAGLIFFVFWISYGLGDWLSNVLVNAPSNGLSYGLSHGVSAGLSYGLSYWFLLGIFRGITSEQIEDHDRQTFNRGVRRTMWNSAVIFLISGVFIGMVGLLSIGLRNGLDLGVSFDMGLLWDGLLGGLNLGLSYTWLNAVLSGLLVSAMIGGWPLLQHYVLRTLLCRTHTFPWHVQRFLDDARTRILLQRIGGGYSFTHRLLLDYFANLKGKVSLASTSVQISATPVQTEVVQSADES